MRGLLVKLTGLQLMWWFSLGAAWNLMGQEISPGFVAAVFALSLVALIGSVVLLVQLARHLQQTVRATTPTPSEPRHQGMVPIVLSIVLAILPVTGLIYVRSGFKLNGEFWGTTAFVTILTIAAVVLAFRAFRPPTS